MTTIDPDVVDGQLAEGLRERAADLGDEDRFYQEVLATIVLVPQRRRLGRWPAGFSRRTSLVLVVALLCTVFIGAALSGAFDRRQTVPPAPRMRNGPVLVEHEGRSWWFDPSTGAEINQGVEQLPRRIQTAAWSRDGRALAFDVAGDLQIMDGPTGERRVLARCEAIGWQCIWPRRTRSLEWSPDNTKIAVAFGSGMWLVDVATGAVTVLIERRANDDTAPILASPSWSADGDWIAFELDDTIKVGLGAIRQLHVIRRDGSDRHRLDVEMPVHSLGLTQPVWPIGGPGIVVPASDDWIDSAAFESATLSFIAIPVEDGTVAGAPIKLADAGEVRCVGCLTFTYGPDGSGVILDDAGVVSVADISRPGIRVLGGLKANPLAWRPVP